MRNPPTIAARHPFVIEVEPGTYEWCACGRSSTQPFCDGSHKGTEFAPVKVEDVEDHKMHAERFSVPAETVDAICEASRVIAVGTTVVRTLESLGELRAGEGTTDIFIRPPFKFRYVDVVLTNFHLPRSTLLMLVSAFASRELILQAYEEAVRNRYRFFSYGDCMLLV